MGKTLTVIAGNRRIPETSSTGRFRSEFKWNKRISGEPLRIVPDAPQLKLQWLIRQMFLKEDRAGFGRS